MITLFFFLSDAAFLSVDPNRLQLFEYEPASFNCEGLGGSYGWRVIREINKTIKKCAPEGEPSAGASCTVENAYSAADSGKYWCENEKGTRSFTVNITVTGVLTVTKEFDSSYSMSVLSVLGENRHIFSSLPIF